jgi:hypothetical protein
MEIRTNSSINVDEPVSITLLALAEGNCSGRFVSWSEDDIKIKVDAGLKIGSVVKLEIGDDLMVAEVRDCKSDGLEYSAGLSLLEWIGKAELQRLMREIACGSAPKLVPTDLAA